MRRATEQRENEALARQYAYSISSQVKDMVELGSYVIDIIMLGAALSNYLKINFIDSIKIIGPIFVFSFALAAGLRLRAGLMVRNIKELVLAI